MNSAEIPRATYHHGDLRTALVSAAEGLLASGATLSLRAVAKAAGVSHAAPYHHFANLDALLAAVGPRGVCPPGRPPGGPHTPVWTPPPDWWGTAPPTWPLRSRVPPRSG